MSFLLLLTSAVPALAQVPGNTFGIYLTGRERAAEFLKALSFRDLPSGPAANSILRLAARGVLRGDGSGRFLPHAVVTRQEAIVALVRLLEWDREVGVPAATTNSGSEAAAWAQPAVSVATARGITGGSDGHSGERPWDAPATREEVAAWMVRALRLKGRFSPSHFSGLLSTYADGSAVSPEYVSDVEQALALGLVQGPTPDRLAPQGGVTRLELARMLDALDRLLPPGRTAFWQLGTVVGQSEEREEQGGKPVLSIIWQIAGPGGTATVLKLTSTPTGEILQGIVVLQGGKLTVGGLAIGQNIRYLVTQQGTVPFAEVFEGFLSRTEGLVEEVTQAGSRLVLVDEGGVRHTFFVSPESAVTIGGQRASLTDLIPSQRVIVQALAGTAWSIAAVEDKPSSTPSPGRYVSGQVRHVDEKHLVVLLPSGVMAEYDLSSGTEVTAGGRASSLNAVKPGDRVELKLPGPDATWVEHINVAGRAGRVEALYRGYLAPFSPRSNEVVLNSPQRLEGETWQNVAAAILRFPLAAGADIWIGDTKVDLTAAEKLRGHIAYVAVTEGFGRLDALRVIIKEGQEQAYTGKVEKVIPALGELELSDGRIALSPGAIVLKDGRLADLYALAEDDSVQVLVDKRKAGELGLVVQVLGRPEVLSETFTVYKGNVKAVGTGAWTLGRYYTLDENEWNYHGRKQTVDLGLNRDTFILSLLGEEPTILSTAEFRQGFYQDLYDEATALAVAQDEETLGIALWPEGQIGAERLTSARAAGIYEDDNTGKVILKMANVLDYSSAKGIWQGGSAEEVRVDKALVVKEGRCSTWLMLQKGDELVVLRQGQTALLILVKE